MSVELNVSQIQHFSTGDGAGIRTTVFLKGCNLRCPWCHNPETWSTEPQVLRYESVGKETLCGTLMSAEEILRDVLSDRIFYEESGGGVTFSGGEAMLQANALVEVAHLIGENGVSVLIDTAGDVPYSDFEKVNPFVDGYLFDYKTDSPEKYEKIGGNIDRVRDNLSRLLADGKDVRVRIPLIPGFNTDEESVRDMCQTLARIGAKTVDLLPFHRMGSGKYKALGIPYPYEDTKQLSAEQLESIEKEFARYFDVTVER